MCLDNNNSVISCDMISEGSVNRAIIDVRKIIECAIRHKAVAIVLAHNHPKGNPTPSGNDFDITGELFRMCRMMHISLLDHIVVGKDRYISMAQTGTLARMMM